MAETHLNAHSASLRVLSLGAGVQSTALFILGCEGEVVPKIDAAVFADTQWEPKYVYAHLAELTRFGSEHGVPVILATRGSLPNDVLNPQVFATIPAWTEESPWEEVPVEVGPCTTCDGDPLTMLGDEECADCFNARVIPVRWEKRLRPPKHSRVKRQCTPKYKVEVIDQQVRILLGAETWHEPCRYCRETGRRVAPWSPQSGEGECSICRGTGSRRRVGSVPVGAHSEQWVGFSTDEIERVSDVGFPRYETPRYPLLELGWTRTDCERFLTERGWQAEKSACIGCPFHDDDIWIEMKHRDPDEFWEVVAFDRQFRTADGLNAKRFLHESRMPLDVAVEIAERQIELNGTQLSLWGEGPRKVRRGCSPYGCRTSEYTEELIA